MITAEQFAAGAQQLAEAWAACAQPGEPSWRWVPSPRPFAASLGGGYLALHASVVAPQRPVAQHAAAAPDGSARQGDQSSCCAEDSGVTGAECEDEDDDPADARRQKGAAAAAAAAGQVAVAAEERPPGQRLALTCHAAYHPSFQVPVLYFEAAGQDGAPLGLRALLEMLPALREAVEGGQAHTVVTHEEHPLLGRPFLMLHPCQTDSVMALLMGQGQQGPADVEHAELAGHANGATGQLDLPAAASQQRCGGGQPEVGDSGERPSMLRYLAAWLSVVAQPLELRLPPARWARLLAA